MLDWFKQAGRESQDWLWQMFKEEQAQQAAASQTTKPEPLSVMARRLGILRRLRRRLEPGGTVEARQGLADRCTKLRREHPAVSPAMPQVDLTSIFLCGFWASAVFGSVIVSTPFEKSAETLLRSTLAGRSNAR